ncbi:MAG: hypothetical protein HYW51_00975 [Candidatus Doudnabacteria bacterium]|nr:hypothetical protein [Candidatus Doudnabacteria bacterium]
MREGTEARYIKRLDRPPDPEIQNRSELGEDAVVLFINSEFPGMEARISTQQEDSGVKDQGSGPAVDAVISKDGKPIIGAQITTAEAAKTKAIKMKELADQPFVRVEGMKPQDPKIPKALIFLDRKSVPKDLNNFDFQRHPELTIQILNGFINSLKFDLAQTKNPTEQRAIQELIVMFEDEKKKYIH